MNRDLQKLQPAFRKKVEKFLQHCQHAGYTVFITEGYRSQERQNKLYAQGRTKRGRKVTWTLNSLHTQGIAIDIAFNEDPIYPTDIEDWLDVGYIAELNGIDWGYTLWGRDLPHFQDNGQPLQDIEKLKNYKMTEEQKKLIELNIAVCGNSYDHGNNEQKQIAQRHANELRSLLINK